MMKNGRSTPNPDILFLTSALQRKSADDGTQSLVGELIPISGSLNCLTLHLVSSGEIDDMSQYNHRVHTVKRFRRALSSAEDRDITLFWYTRPWGALSINDRSTWSRIFMHCIAMLSEADLQLV